jgi:Protein of unknown function (DUF2934)
MASYHSYSGSSSSTCAPDPYRSNIPKAATDHLLTPNKRHKWISEAAYFIAERRGFVPGAELADWIAAESNLNRVCGLTNPRPDGTGREKSEDSK